VYLTRKIVEYARNRGIGEIFGDVLADNTTMLKLSRVLGFTTRAVPDEPGVVRIHKDLSEEPV
jgi:L-amino acid N-acyltransferase YncA